MKYLLLAVGIFALSNISFAEEVEETLDKEQEAEDKKVISLLEKQNKAEDEETKDETRVKRAARRGVYIIFSL
ncbi:unnamed protein product [Cylicostephanus goldi]|uniref:Uncharacterized protein n=1 Tax=Cylicostephanus goldi TaxID=71465 RepID=A0A3P6SCB8_CYLGO|nr:unnamed protein product [Cylicostephanus goldi]